MAEGLQSSIRLKSEVTYGTQPVAAHLIVPYLTESLQKQFGARISNSNLDANPAVNSIGNTGWWAGGDVSMVPTYENMDWAIWGVLGAAASSAGPPFTNDYTPALAVPSYHVEMDRNESAGLVFRYTGQKVSQVTMSWSATAEPSATVTLVGQDEVSASGGDTKEPTADTTLGDLMLSPQEIGTLNIGTGGDDFYCVRDMSFTINRSIVADGFCLGSASAVNEPLVTAKIVVTGSFTIEATDRAYYEIYTAQTDVTTIKAIITDGTSTFQIQVNKARYDTPSVPQVSGPGTVLATINFTAYGNSGTAETSEPIAIRTINTVEGSAVL